MYTNPKLNVCCKFGRMLDFFKSSISYYYGTKFKVTILKLQPLAKCFETFILLAYFPFETEAELIFYHQKLNAQVASPATE